MSEISKYTKADVIKLLIGQGEIFDVARLVNVGMTHQLELNEDRTDLIETNYNCYAVWNKEHRCEHCVSAMAYKCMGKKTKFEFVDNEVYYVVAKYIEVDGTPFMLELVTKIDDQTLFGAYGKEKFVDTIIGYNQTLYVDPLTKAYNRNYYDTQLIGLSRVKAVAMFDIDHFKEVNDTFGHAAGDEVLKRIIQTILSLIDSSDSVVRYGGDEFLVMFENIDKGELNGKLEQLRSAVEAIKIDTYPDIKTSISVGGVYCDNCTSDTVKQADEFLYKAKQTRNTVCSE